MNRFALLLKREYWEHKGGFVWAPMNQRRDDTKPTWVLGVELRMAVGKIARFDRLRHASGSTPTAALRLEMQKIMQRDAAEAARRQRFPPAGFLRSEIEDGQQPR